MTELKKWITTALLTLLLLPAMAQQKADTTYTFRFVPREDMFYVPWNGNDTELARLLATATRWAVKPRTLPRQRSVPTV